MVLLLTSKIILPCLVPKKRLLLLPPTPRCPEHWLLTTAWRYLQSSGIGRGYVAAQVAVDQAEKNAYVDPAALDKRAMERPKFHRDQSTIKNSEIFGDISGMEGPTWNSAQPSEEVEIPDFQKMYEKYTKF